MSDTITVGNIHHSIATAIGDGATAVVHFINNPLHPDDRPKAVIHLPALAPAFTGRLSLIQNIASGFISGNGYSMVVTQAISGLGGVGKTQAALAYAHLYRSAYNIIWQLTADNNATLDDGLRQLGLTLELRLLGLDAAAMRGKVLSHLSQSGERVLLIYDNADAIAPRDLLPYLPSGCHTLITSRRDGSQWGDMAKPLTLGAFTEAEGMAFWERRLGGEPGVQLLSKAKLLELGEALGWLPLAMEQAAAYMLAVPVNAAEYLQEFTQERDALWQREDVPNLYHATVETTWKMAFDHAKKTDGAADLLNLLSFFAPDDIPLAVVWDGANELPSSLTAIVADKWKRRDSLKALRTYSLLTVTDGNANMHRLVQDVARRAMGAGMQGGGGNGGQVWVEAAMGVLNKAYHFDRYDTGTWAACGQLLPHVIVAVNLAADLGVESAQVAYLNNQVGVYLNQYGDSGGALPFFQQALDIRRKVLGDDHLDTAISLVNMGYLLQTMGELTIAQPYYERALTISKKILEPDDIFTANILNNLGALLLKIEKLETAQPHLENALDIREKMLGEHPDTAISLDNMGYLMQGMGKLPEARSYHERALEIGKTTLDPMNPNLAYSFSNLGRIMKKMGEMMEARPYYEKALEILKNTFGDVHPKTAMSLNNLVKLQYDLEVEIDQQMIDDLKNAVITLEKAYGDMHSTTCQVRDNLERINAAAFRHDPPVTG